MAKKVTPASLGVSTAQLWDTTAVNESFKTILANKRQDDQAAAERERQDQLLADKKHDAQQKWIRDELMGYDPDMSNIWESRDGNHLRELANEGFADLLADPGMGEKLYNNDPAAITKLKQFKANIAGRIQKSAEDKVKAAPYIDLMDKYTNAKKAGEVYEDPNYYGNDLDDMSAAFFTPGADIYAPIEKADAMGSWNDYVKEQNAAFKNRDQSVSDHTNPTTGLSYKSSGGKRSEDEISDMIDYHWQQAPNARWMYDQLGIDFNKFNKGDALSPEEQKAIDDFTSDRKREASLDTTESISRGVIKQAPKTKEEEVAAYNRINEMTQVLQNVEIAPGQFEFMKYTKDEKDPVYEEFGYKSGSDWHNHFDDVFSDVRIIKSRDEELNNILSILRAGGKAAELVADKSGDDLIHKIAFVDDKGNARLIDSGEYSSIASGLASGEGLKNWNMQTQDAMNKAGVGGVSTNLSAEELIEKYSK
jgi:hypothetical protein